MTKKKSFLWTVNILNFFCLLFAFQHNTWNYGNKWSLSRFHSLWEFFTIWWCVWSSILLFFYNFREMRFNNSRQKLAKKKSQNGRLGLVTTSTCLTSVIGFTLAFTGKVCSEKGRTELLKMPRSWWIYSFTWHYLVFPLALIYFFKYSEEENFRKREILYLVIPLPILFFLANLARSSWADQNYFNQKPSFLKSRIFWFDFFEKQKYWLLLAWIGFSIFYFWVVSYLLLRLKKWLRLSEIFPLKNKQTIRLDKKKQTLFNN